MKDTWKDALSRQRSALELELQAPLQKLAAQCAQVWSDRNELDIVLTDGFRSVPYGTFLYVIDTNGIQISDNISASAIMPEHYGRDRSGRPYVREIDPARTLLLSSAYLSLRANRPSLTAVQAIQRDGGTLGYLCVDFDLRDLPATAAHYEESAAWRQIKGDPAIRGTVFQQCRIDSLMDQNMDPAIAILEELVTERGMFQCVIHFSSSRATIWFLDDPYRYRILDHEALADPDICMLYERKEYPRDALIPQQVIGRILRGMRYLRSADETLYLRSASINIFNGMISLTFSCDGSHYMSWSEFLARDMSFWVGSAA